MLEWDLDSYQRKFEGTTAIFKNKDGLFQFNTKTVNEEGINNFVFEGWGHEKLQVTPEVHPVYHRVEAGYYYEQYRDIYVSIERRFKKNYRIGICNHNYIFFSPEHLDIQMMKVNWLKKPEVKEEHKSYALSHTGVLSNKLYITKNSVYYLSKQVGYRSGSKFIVDKPIWQEVSDALRGHECKILT